MEAWSDPLYNNTLDIFTTAVRNGNAKNTYTAGHKGEIPQFLDRN